MNMENYQVDLIKLYIHYYNQTFDFEEQVDVVLIPRDLRSGQIL